MRLIVAIKMGITILHLTSKHEPVLRQKHDTALLFNGSTFQVPLKETLEMTQQGLLAVSSIVFRRAL